TTWSVGATTTNGLSNTVRRAAGLVAEPFGSLRITSYQPSLANVTLLTVRVASVAPGIAVPLKRHWYGSGAGLNALTLNEALRVGVLPEWIAVGEPRRGAG